MYIMAMLLSPLVGSLSCFSFPSLVFFTLYSLSPLFLSPPLPLFSSRYPSHLFMLSLLSFPLTSSFMSSLLYLSLPLPLPSSPHLSLFDFFFHVTSPLPLPSLSFSLSLSLTFSCHLSSTSAYLCPLFFSDFSLHVFSPSLPLSLPSSLAYYLSYYSISLFLSLPSHLAVDLLPPRSSLSLSFTLFLGEFCFLVALFFFPIAAISSKVSRK